MIEGENIICISNTTWYGQYTKSTVQIMSMLARRNRVVFVEYPFTIKDIFTSIFGKQNAPVARMLGLKKRLQIIKTENASKVRHLVVPPVVPVDFIKNDKIFQFFFRFNKFIYKRVLLKTIKKLNLSNPIIITAYNPFYGLPLIGKLKEKSNIYYCYDGIGTRRHGERIYEIDELFSKSVDGIITTSDHLNRNKKKMNPHSYVVKNGVDFKLFTTQAKSNISPLEIRKKIGYIGSLDHRFDIDTVEHAIQKLSQFDFEFTGNLRNGSIKQRLEKYSNVKFYPAIAPKEVPSLLAEYDLGIIPYLENAINRNIYPLKINEYLAVGVPIVMTSFADLPEFKRYVSTANSKDDFVQKILNEIRNDQDKLIPERIRFAESNSWENKAIEFGSILKKIITNGNNK
ncbi:MAG: glycosyltransferase [Marinifilaceae bacterium]